MTIETATLSATSLTHEIETIAIVAGAALEIAIVTGGVTMTIAIVAGAALEIAIDDETMIETVTTAIVIGDETMIETVTIAIVAGAVLVIATDGNEIASTTVIAVASMIEIVLENTTTVESARRETEPRPRAVPRARRKSSRGRACACLALQRVDIIAQDPYVITTSRSFTHARDSSVSMDMSPSSR